MDDTFGKFALSKGEHSIPKGFGNEDVICYDCLQSQQKLEQPKREESKPEPKDKFVFKDKQSTETLPTDESNTIWILPILLGWIGGVIMYFVLKDEDKERGLKGLYVGIVISVICSIVGFIIFFLVGIQGFF